MSLKVDYFVQKDVMTVGQEEILVSYDARSVPATIRAIEGVKGRSFWIDRDNWRRAYNRLCQQQARLLMDSTDRLVREIRALRDGVDTPVPAQDAQVDPFTLDLFTLRSISGKLSTDGESNAFILAQIRELLITQGEGQLLDSEVLAQIAAIIVGL